MRRLLNSPPLVDRSWLEISAWTEIDAGSQTDAGSEADAGFKAGARTLVIPVGATEQHGPHLPLGVDAVVAEFVAQSIVELAAAHGVPMLLGPTQSYGASGEHEDFPGTVSIGTAALTTVLIEIGRSAARWADRILVISGHGGNVDALAAASAALRAETPESTATQEDTLGTVGIDFAWAPCGDAVEGSADATDLHAGRTETSLMLAIRPDSVRPSAAEPGPVEPFASLIGRLRQSGVRAVSPNGVLGDPTGASAYEGRRHLARICDEVWSRIELWSPDRETGLLALPADD